MPSAAARRERNAVGLTLPRSRPRMVNQLCSDRGKLLCLQNNLCGPQGGLQLLVMGLLHPFQTHDAASLTANAQALSVNQHLVDVANCHQIWSTLRQPAHASGNDRGISSPIKHGA